MYKLCSYCHQDFDVDSDHWYQQKYSGGTYLKCVVQNRKNVKRWRANNPERTRFRSHCDYDKSRGLVTDITLSWYTKTIQLPCFYCGQVVANGLDRKDSSLGHTEKNCVPCCSKCNIILGDIPLDAKLELMDGLKSIRQKALLVDWKVPGQRNTIYV